jgi:hypothetical protein
MAAGLRSSRKAECADNLERAGVQALGRSSVVMVACGACNTAVEGACMQGRCDYTAALDIQVDL